MAQRVEAVFDEVGNIYLLESIKVQGLRRAWVTVLEEDEAWFYLQLDQ